MMMRVDQAGQDDMTFEIEHFIGGLRKRVRWPDLFDEAVSNEKSALGNFARAVSQRVVIHRDDVSVFDEKGCHFGVELSKGIVV